MTCRTIVNMCKSAVFILLLAFPAASSFALTETDQRVISYQLEISDRVTEYFSELFTDFSGGYIEAGEVLRKLSLAKNEYNLSLGLILPEGERLHELMKKLFSQIENYFIFYKRTDRENPEINLKIAELRFEIYKEVVRLQYLM